MGTGSVNKVEAYRASNGRLFETAQECRIHETALIWRTCINQFVESDFCPCQRGTTQEWMVHKVIVGWEQFKEAHVASEPSGNREVAADRLADVSALGLVLRSELSLHGANINTVEELIRHTEVDLLKIPNLGNKSLSEIKTALAVRGLSLACSPSEVEG